MPVPYNVNFELNVFVANSDDGLQIIEQILPIFQPDYTVTMILDNTYMDTKRDIPFILENVSYDDSYTGTRNKFKKNNLYFTIYSKNISVWVISQQSALLKKYLLIYIQIQIVTHQE